MASYDALAVASAVGRAVPRISVGTAVVPIYPRHPQILASAAKTAQAATDGRFQLKGRTLGDADAAVTVTQSRVHGHGTIFPGQLPLCQPAPRQASPTATSNDGTAAQNPADYALPIDGEARAAERRRTVSSGAVSSAL